MKSVLLTLLFLLLLFARPASAHPGRTAADGCHYCRTNCDSWGKTWNERHCHDSDSSSPMVIPKTYTPTYTPKLTTTPYPINTPIPTNTPILTNTPTPIFNSQNTTQEVAGTSTSSNNSTISTILGLLVLSGLISGIYFKNKKDKSKSSPNNL